MNEIRARHLVERAAVRLREDLRLAPESSSAPEAVPVPAPAPAHTPESLVAPEPVRGLPVSPVSPVSPALRRPAEAVGAPEGDSVTMAVLQRAGLVLAGGRRNRIVEEFSVTAGALLRGLRAGPLEAPPGEARARTAGALSNVLLVTSARPGEGKTFSALNLAATLAHNGLARVVLADVDSKPASLTAQLGLQARRGLFDLAADPTLAPQSLLVGTGVRDLSILPLGTREAAGQGPVRRLNAAIELVARRLAGQVVVLDAPPCLATSEPAGLAPIVGLVAMVVEAERTQRSDIEAALDLVATCPSIMLVLNKIRGTRGHAFGYYDYYGS